MNPRINWILSLDYWSVWYSTYNMLIKHAHELKIKKNGLLHQQLGHNLNDFKEIHKIPSEVQILLHYIPKLQIIAIFINIHWKIHVNGIKSWENW